MFNIQLLGKVMSLLSFIGLFTLVPKVLYQLWPSLLHLAHKTNNPKVAIFTISGMIGTLSSLLAHNLFYFIIYNAKIPFFQKYRITPEKSWPWEKDPTWKNRFWKIIAVVFMNSVVISTSVGILESKSHELQYKYSLEDWPKIHIMVSQFILFLLINQVLSYMTHRFLHNPLLYKIHKLHHSHTTTLSITATYAHPFEYIFSNVIPAVGLVPLISMLMDVHLVTLMLWIYFRMTQTIEVHSGYEFPWGVLSFLPFKSQEDFHDFHHSHNSGTFGSMLVLMDRMMGTDKDYLQFINSKKANKIK